MLATENRTLLEKVGIKANRYRLELLDYMKHSREHASADTIYHRLSSKYPDISFATVYNNLNLFYDRKLVRRFFTPEREARYDFAGMPHHHFVCEKCAAVEDIPSESVNLTLSQELTRHLKIQSTETVFYGVCPTCQANTELA